MGVRSPAVDRYLKHSPAAHSQAFEVIRDLIHSIQPNVVESVQYNMPLFDHHGMLCSFDSQPHTMSLYCKAELIDRYRDQLGSLVVSKGCIRFTKLDDVPLDILSAMLMDAALALESAARQSD